VTYRALTDAEASAVFRSPGVASCVRRLSRLGVQGFEVGRCEHGPVVKAQVQMGRVMRTLTAHEAGGWVAGMDAIVEIVEAGRRKARRR
jgi:hypothetical protein